VRLASTVGTIPGASTTAGTLGEAPHLVAVALGLVAVVPATGAHQPGVEAIPTIMSTRRSITLMSTTSIRSMTMVAAMGQTPGPAALVRLATTAVAEVYAMHQMLVLFRMQNAVVLIKMAALPRALGARRGTARA